MINVIANCSQVYAATFTDEEKAIRETADAYFYRGENAQYSGPRRAYGIAPEEATSQHKIYSVCINLAYIVYEQAFGIKLPYTNKHLMSYAKTYYDSKNIKTNDVIEYWEKSTKNNKKIYIDNQGNTKKIDLSTSKGIEKYKKELLNKIQIGDILCWLNSSKEGHTVIVYDFVYNKKGERTDAIIRESVHNYSSTGLTKLPDDLNFATVKNNKYNIKEGTFSERYLLQSYTERTESKPKATYFENVKGATYFTIVRPLPKDKTGNYTGKYYESTYEKDTSSLFGYKYTRKAKTYQVSDVTLQRIKYNKIYIEKTVDKFNNSVVTPGDKLTYTIIVKNNSDKAYGAFEIVENIPEGVTLDIDEEDAKNATKSNNTLTWKIGNGELTKGKTIIKKYTVTVNQNVTLGIKIKSTGTVAGIPSSTVTNIVSNNLTTAQKKIIIEKTESNIKGTIQGEKLISKIYKDSFEIDLQLNKLKLTELINIDATLLALRKTNPFYDIVLKNYYGALSNSDLKTWTGGTNHNKRSARADTIYDENFQTGDILIYTNQQTKAKAHEAEKGTYYFIYVKKMQINGKEYNGFIGKTSDGIKNIERNYKDLQTLLGKDYFVVLRPSLLMATKVQLDKSKLTLDMGKTATLNVTITPSNALDKGVVWNSSKSSVATVDKNGKVTAVGEGTAIITATTKDGSKTASCTVTVKVASVATSEKVAVTKVKLNKTKTTLTIGENETLVATVEPSNASDKSVTWSSNKTNVATVDKNGKVIAVGEGTAIITVTTKDGSKIASCTVTVKVKEASAASSEKVAVTKVRLNKTKTALAIGENEILVATVEPSNVSDKRVTWSSNQPNVATVDKITGKVTAVGVGTATITVTTEDENKMAQCTITIKEIESKTGDLGGDSTATTEIYEIEVMNTGMGKITPQTTKITKGENITFTIRPNEGYEIKDVLVDGKSVGKKSVYIFSKVDSNHSITAEYMKQNNNLTDEKIGLEKWNNPFKDVEKKDWYYNAVEYAVENKLFNGMTKTEFGPNISMTRGMLVTVLYRMNGTNEMGSSMFSDVANNLYYTNAIAWASKNEIVKGIGNKQFAPDRSITREELATIIVRYIQKFGIEVEGNTVTQAYTDENEIASYAKENVKIMQEKGLMTGKNNNQFDPKGQATRAEVATLMMRLAL